MVPACDCTLFGTAVAGIDVEETIGNEETICDVEMVW